MDTNTRVLLKNYVVDRSPTLDDFEFDNTMPPNKDSLKDGQIIVRSLYLSVDPYQRGRIVGATGRYIESYKINEPLSNLSVSIVEASASTKFKIGDYVATLNGKWESQFVISDDAVKKVLIGDNISPVDYIGVLGIASFTAYYGMVALGKLKAGETIVVSSASGAVGQMAVQLAKIRGLRVIGIAGSDEKIKYIKGIGADDAFNYKTCGDYTEAIKKYCPEGVDVYFDNVGGRLLDAILANVNNYARVISCGAISRYDKSPDNHSMKNYINVIQKRVSINGYIILDYFNTKIEQDFIDEVSTLYKEGKIKYKIHESLGLKSAPQALLDLFDGRNFGKSVVKV